MRLQFSLLHRGMLGGDEFWVAPEDGAAFDRNTFMQDLYEIRTTPALRRDTPDTPYRVSTPDGYIIASGVTYRDAVNAANADVNAEPALI
jgi:hypothetical protein